MNTPLSHSTGQPRPPASRLTRALLSLGLVAAAHSSLSAQVLYWGGGATTPTQSVNTTSQSPNPGTWDNTITNWNTSASATGGWQAWTSGATALIKSDRASGSAAIALGDDITVGGITVDNVAGTQSATLSTFGGGNWINYNRSSITGISYTFSPSSGSKTVTLSPGALLFSNVHGGNPQIVFGANTILAGTGGANILGRVQIGSQSTLSGKVGVAGLFTNTSGHGSELSLIGGSSLANVNSFDIGRAAMFRVSKSSAVTNVIGDSASVILRNGEFRIEANNANNNEKFGSLTLEGSGRVIKATNTAMSLETAINRGTNGKGTLYVNSAGQFGSAFQILGHGFAANQAVIPYAVIAGSGGFLDTAGNAGTGTRFMATDSSGNLRAAVSTAAATDLSTWDTAGYTASSNLYLTATPTSALDANVTIGTLTAATATTNLNLGGNKLEVNAIAATAATNIGSDDASRGTITTATGRDLYVIGESAGWNAPLVVNIRSVVADSTGADPGATNLILAGATGNFSLQAANTHTGKTYINAWNVSLSTNGRLLTTSELNISSGSTFTATINDAQNKWGSAAVSQTLSGSGLYIANAQTVEIGANGTLAPGNLGAGETLNFQFTSGKLSFLSGSTVELTLGTLSDSIAFTTAGDWLSGSGNFRLDLTSGSGFANDIPYTVFHNVTTTGFSPGSVWLDGTQLDSGDYTWQQVGNDYVFTYAVPEPSTAALLAGFGLLSLVLRRRR